MPLVLYEGGGPEAVFEPLQVPMSFLPGRPPGRLLQDHLAAYNWGLAQYLGAGVAACYRGHRLYDTNTTREVVRAWVSFYKKHREVLGADLVHLRRANMQVTRQAGEGDSLAPRAWTPGSTLTPGAGRRAWLWSSTLLGRGWWPPWPSACTTPAL